MSQVYGVLRVLRTGGPILFGNIQKSRLPRWKGETGQVFLLTRRETCLGRTLSNDICLLDAAVSREHARLVLDASGWHLVNLSNHDHLSINGHPVPKKGECSIQPLDSMTLGETTLQLIAPYSSLSEPFPALREERATFVCDEQEKKGPKKWTRAQQRPYLPLTVTSWMRRWLWWLLASVALILLALETTPLLVDSSLTEGVFVGGNFLGLLGTLTLPLLPALALVLLVHVADRFEHLSWWSRLAAFLWGAVVALALALVLETRTYSVLQPLFGPQSLDLARSALQGLIPGVIEETAKGIGLLVFFFLLRATFTTVTDGLLYGVLVGAGFALVENLFYFAPADKTSLASLIVGRLLLGWLYHSTFTACFGAALGTVRQKSRGSARPEVLPMMGFIVAVGLHSCFDFLAVQAERVQIESLGNGKSVPVVVSVALVCNYLLPLLAQLGLFLLLVKGWAHETAVLGECLVEEVYAGRVTSQEYVLVQRTGQRRREEWRLLRQHGWKRYRLLKAVYRAEKTLAFSVWQVKLGLLTVQQGQTARTASRERIARLRSELLHAQACDAAQQEEEHPRLL